MESRGKCDGRDECSEKYGVNKGEVECSSEDGYDDFTDQLERSSESLRCLTR